MKSRRRNGLLVGAGFLLGTAGMKALTSKTAKRCYVQGVAKGLRAKTAYQNVVEQAKAGVDDIVAEAAYLNIEGSGEPSHDGCEVPSENKASVGKKSK